MVLRLVAAVCGAGLVASATPAFAQAPDDGALVSKLVACEQVADERARLACFENILADDDAADEVTAGDVAPEPAPQPAVVSTPEPRPVSPVADSDDAAPPPAEDVIRMARDDAAEIAPDAHDVVAVAEDEAAPSGRRRLLGVPLPFSGGASASESSAPNVAVASAPAASVEAGEDFGFTEVEIERRRYEALDAEARREAERLDRERNRVQARVLEVRERGDGKHLIRLDNGQLWLETDFGDLVEGPPDPGEEVEIAKTRFGGFRLRVSDRYGVIGVRRLE